MKRDRPAPLLVLCHPLCPQPAPGVAQTIIAAKKTSIGQALQHVGQCQGSDSMVIRHQDQGFAGRVPKDHRTHNNKKRYSRKGEVGRKSHQRPRRNPSDRNAKQVGYIVFSRVTCCAPCCPARVRDLQDHFVHHASANRCSQEGKTETTTYIRSNMMIAYAGCCACCDTQALTLRENSRGRHGRKLPRMSRSG